MAVPDSVAARLKSYDDALEELAPQIRGLEDKVNDALSDELREVLNARLAFLTGRRSDVQAALNAQNAADSTAAHLDSLGFPNLPDMEISPALMAELATEDADNAAASGGFTASTAPPQAAEIKLTLGTPRNIP